MECPSYQYIQKIYIWHGSMIDAIQFVTNTGMETAKFGGKGGDRSIVDAKDKKFCAVKGRYTDVINQLAFGVSHYWSTFNI